MTRGIHWFRNDLRIQDNTALVALCARVDQWLPVFVLDPRILGKAADATPRRAFLLDCVERLGRGLAQRGIPLVVRRGRPERVLPKLLRDAGAQVLSFNEDTTPFARRRDAEVARSVAKLGIETLTRVDHVVFRASEIRTGSGGPYSVYSPYRRSWWKRWHEAAHEPRRVQRLPAPIPGYARGADTALQSLTQASLESKPPTGGEQAARRRLRSFLQGAAARYHEDRDRPDLDGTSRLSPYLRFGAISPRQCFEGAIEAAALEPRTRKGIEKWLDELIWREFYAGILEEHPRVLKRNYRPQYDAVRWDDDARGFEAWCLGRTGFPIVDAGMRQLRATGWMHNRVRMIVASFLTKDLLIDWRQGERFFFQHLVDGDPASNNGGWQWAASTGTDAQPYFRIFNPIAQGQRWDPEGRYVRRWVPELRKLSGRVVHEPWEAQDRIDYPQRIVDHAERRTLALERFRAARRSGAQA